MSENEEKCITDNLERLRDLVRYQRSELLNAGLITDDEYCALLQIDGSPRRLEGYDALRAELEKVKMQRDNLLCRIHRDGGHYIAEHGIGKACDDADSRVATLNVDCENLREENKRLKNLFEGQAKLLQICNDVGSQPQEILRLQGELSKVKGERERFREALRESLEYTNHAPACRNYTDCDCGFDDFQEKAQRVLGELG